MFWKFCRSRNGCSIGINSGCCPNCGSTLGKTFGWCQPLYWTYLFHWVFDKFIQKSLEELNSIYYMLKYFFLILHFLYSIMRVQSNVSSSRRGYRKKMNLLKISRFPDFIQYFPDFSQCFPNFLLTKFFKVLKCKRCGSLNPRLSSKLGFSIVILLNLKKLVLNGMIICYLFFYWNFTTSHNKGDHFNLDNKNV